MNDTTKVLFVVTSNDRLGDSGRKTGLHFEELATPYYILRDAGYEVVLASPRGGAAPVDPGSQKARGENVASVERFLDDETAMGKLAETVPLEEIDAAAFAGVYLPGGHGTMWDLPDNATLGRLLCEFDRAGKVVAAVCHGPAGLVAARRADGTPLVEGRRVNAFTDAEERAVELDSVVPFLLESRLRELGARFEGTDNFAPKVVVDDRLVTGQNPASAQPLGEQVLALLREQSRSAAQ